MCLSLQKYSVMRLPFFFFFLYNPENPDLVKPIVTMIDDNRLTTEFVLLEIAAIEKKVNAEIESERCIPIINKVCATRNILYIILYTHIYIYKYISIYSI